ncbi:MAG: hypothetical protein V5783_11210 [Pontiella sp.]
MEQDSKNQLDFNFVADDLLEFPRDLGEEGWFQFTNEQKVAFQRVEEKFHIILNQRVCMRLRGRMDELVGKLVLATPLLPSPTAETIMLRMGSVTFENTDIDHIRVLD